MSNYVHVQVEEIKHETDKAFLVIIDGDERWIPKTQIADSSDYEVGDKNITISITDFIAEKLGIEGD